MKELCRKHEFSDAAFYGWRSKFGGLQPNKAEHFRELEAENAKLQKLLAEAHMDFEAMKVAFGEALSPQAKRAVVRRMRAEVSFSRAARPQAGERLRCPYTGLRQTRHRPLDRGNQRSPNGDRRRGLTRVRSRCRASRGRSPLAPGLSTSPW